MLGSKNDHAYLVANTVKKSCSLSESVPGLRRKLHLRVYAVDLLSGEGKLQGQIYSCGGPGAIKMWRPLIINNKFKL
jgi:hypothetical protein